MNAAQRQQKPGMQQQGMPQKRQQQQQQMSNGIGGFSPAYYAQFSQMPDPGRYGYAQTLQRQYPGMQFDDGWMRYNQLVGLAQQLAPGAVMKGGVQMRDSTPVAAPPAASGDMTQEQRNAQHARNMGYSGEGRYAGGLVSLAQGGYLPGQTDGMADAIPASIDGQQPAAISDGEFVVPADVVSGLGNGNSKAGAATLYEMLERVREARTGKSSQPKSINPDKFLPA